MQMANLKNLSLNLKNNIMAKKKKLPKAQSGFIEYITGSPHIMGKRYYEPGHPMYETYMKGEGELEYNGTPPKTIKAIDYIGNPMGYFNAKAKERKDAAFASKYRNINGELN